MKSRAFLLIEPGHVRKSSLARFVIGVPCSYTATIGRVKFASSVTSFVRLLLSKSCSLWEPSTALYCMVYMARMLLVNSYTYVRLP